MSIATPALDACRDALPDELKDIRLNLTAVLTGENLPPAQAFGTALAAAEFLRCAPLADALAADIRAGLGDTAAAVISDAIAAAGLMAMNTVYYRFRHMLDKESYTARSPRLRMSRMAQPATGKLDFELMSLGCAALAGCELCIRNHEASLVHLGASEDACHDTVRIAAVINAVACGLGAARSAGIRA
jgi:alkyl hydroperoxide reductase subunit D